MLVTNDDHDAQGGAAGGQGHGHHRVDTEVADPGGPGVSPGHPVGDRGVGHPVQQSTSRPETRDRRGTLRIDVHLARSDDRLGGSRIHRVVGDTPQPDRAACHAEGRLLGAVEGGKQIDTDEVGEFRDDHLRQFLSRPHHIESGADPRTGIRDQHQTLTGPERLGHVLNAQTHAQNITVFVLQRSGDDRPSVFTVLAEDGPVDLQELRITALQRLLHGALHAVHLRIVYELRSPQPACVVIAEAHGTLRELIEPAHAQLGVVLSHGDTRDMLVVQAHESVVVGPGPRLRQRGEPGTIRVARCPAPFCAP
ncbi:hypothetical protein GCM10023083_84960 [Streptomyces phyllanthi]